MTTEDAILTIVHQWPLLFLVVVAFVCIVILYYPDLEGYPWSITIVILSGIVTLISVIFIMYQNVDLLKIVQTYDPMEPEEIKRLFTTYLLFEFLCVAVAECMTIVILWARKRFARKSR